MRAEIASVTIAIGTFRKKITRQLEISISQPPSSGPTTVEMPLQAVQVPIAAPRSVPENVDVITASDAGVRSAPARPCKPRKRSEEHTSELQSRFDLVCRLLLEKKK